MLPGRPALAGDCLRIDTLSRPSVISAGRHKFSAFLRLCCTRLFEKVSSTIIDRALEDAGCRGGDPVLQAQEGAALAA